MGNLIDQLLDNAAQFPKKPAFIVVDYVTGMQEQIEFGMLDKTARSIAGTLGAKGLAGAPVILLTATRLSWISCFFGCLYAGVIPVPLPIPRHQKSWARVDAVAKNSGAAAIITDRRTKAQIDKAPDPEGSIAEYQWIMMENLTGPSQTGWVANKARGDDIAFLQYTSGSTGRPKGVMVSHQNLITNITEFSSHFRLGRETVSVSWLPLFHDMGLVAHVILPVILGCTSVLFDPLAFVMQPIRWLKTISDFRGTFSGGPNFAYELCVNRIRENDLDPIDLSSWHTAYSGAEPVREKTLDRFSALFSKTGFQKKSLYPVYGLAEATLMVSGKPSGTCYHSLRSDNTDSSHLSLGTHLVSCGTAAGRQKIFITNPQTQIPVPEGQIGEIWVAGDNISRGYWKDPDASARQFVVHPVDGRRYVRTGDLGFLKAGELYITGRLKDIIVLNGENFSSEDMEYAIALSHPGFSISGCAVFSIIRDDWEHVVAACELPPGHDPTVRPAMALAANTNLMDLYGVPLFDLVFTAQLPRTTSGKVQRYLCRRHYLDHTFKDEFSRTDHPCLVKARLKGFS